MLSAMTQSLSLRLNWWTTWSNQESNRRVMGALLTVGGCTVLGKLVAFVKDAVVAYQFGTGDALDAFLIALVVPQFTVTLLGSSLNAALIPTYIRVKEQQGAEAAQQVLSSVMVLTVSFLIAGCLILALSAPWIMPILAGGYAPEKLDLARALYVVLLSTVLLGGIGTIWAAVLNAGNRFAWAAAVPIVTSMLTIVMVLSLGEFWSGYALATAAIGGAFLETLLLGWQLKRTGVSLTPHWYGITPAVKQVLGQYWPMVAAAFLMGSTHLVSQAMAAMLDPGSVAALSYGNKITTVLIGVGATAVSTAFLPHFSWMVVGEDWHGIKHTLMLYSGLLMLVSIPVCILLMHYSEQLVALLFQRGAFTEADTRLVGNVQAVSLLQLAPYLIGILYVRFITAIRCTHVMVWGNVLNLVVCVSLNYVLMKHLGVVGIALATSAMYFVSCGFLIAVSWFLLRKHLRPSISSGLTTVH